MKVRELLRELQAADPEAEVMVSAPRSGDSNLLLPSIRVETGAFPYPRADTGELYCVIQGTDAWGQYLPSRPKKSTVETQRGREVLNWQTVVRAVHAVDAQHRGPGPGMDDDAVLNSVLDVIFKYAVDKTAARMATAYPDPDAKK